MTESPFHPDQSSPDPRRREPSNAAEDRPAQMPGDAIPLAPGVWVAERDLEFTFARSGGPGGQSVNKVNTQAQLRIAVEAISGLTERATSRLRRLAGQRLTKGDTLLIQSQTHRSQMQNRAACIERLKELVTEAAREPRRRKRTRPSRAMIERRIKQKKERGEKKSRRGWKPPPEG